MWKSTVEQGRTQMKMWRMCLACWVSENIDTHTHNLLHYFFSWQKGQRAFMYFIRMYIACFVKLCTLFTHSQSLDIKC